MNESELKAYATRLMVSHAEEVEWLTIVEMGDELPGGSISEEDAQTVSDLIRDAKVTITW